MPEPPLPEAHATKPDYSTLEFPPPPTDRPYVLTNMVMSADGKAVIEGTERGLGSAVDQRLMRELRAGVDIVLTGAGTLRASGTSPRVRDADLEQSRRTRGRSPNPLAAVLSVTGELPLERAFFTAADFDAVIYLSPSASPQRRAAIEATGRRVFTIEGDAVRSMLRHMRGELGAEVVLVEGGPSLNAELFAGGLVDEYFLTIGPLIVGGDHTLTPVGGAQPPSLASTARLELLSSVHNPETSELYLRYRVAGRGALER